MVKSRLVLKSETLKQMICYLSLYSLLLLDSGYYFVAQGSYYIGMQIALATVLLFICGSKVNNNILAICFLMILLVMFSSLANGDSVRNMIVTSTEIIIAGTIANSIFYNPDMIIHSWRKLIVIIAAFSIIVYFLTIVPNTLLSRFPIFGATGELPAYFVGLSFAYSPRAYFIARNLGLFWEPGAYQTYLILALICEMFLFSSKNRIHLIILTIAIITTLSTTGIISGLVLWTLYAFKQKSKAYSILLITLIISMIIVVFTNLERLPQYVQFSIFTKVVAVFGRAGTSTSIITADTRVNSFTYGVKLFFENPITGIGRSMGALKDIMDNNTASCTPINWLAQYGIFVGAIIYLGMYSVTRFIGVLKVDRMILLGVFLLSLSTEAFNFSPTIIFLAFLGFSPLSVDKSEVNI